MTAALARRGPDGEGVWTASGVGLGHRRLSVNDPDGPALPMRDGALTVTCDGEIYNVAELRAELAAKGACFRTAGDMEVLLHGWRAWGPTVLDRLDGVFAFALHDADRRSLFLARDRVGAKPLHYTELSDGSVAFASELKGLLAHPLLRRRPDLSAVEDYLAYGYVPDDACLVAGVRKLAAGHWLLLEGGRPVPAPWRWWDLDFSRRHAGTASALGEELLAHMRRAVRSRMRETPATFLLGGGDDAAVVALMAEASRGAVTSCTIGFDGAASDGPAFAQGVADRFHTDHHVRLVPADDRAAAGRLAAAFDEPFAAPSALTALYAAELARAHATAALSGVGADEAVAGHRRYRFLAAAAGVRRALPAAVREPVFGVLGRIRPGTGGALAAPGLSEGEAHARSVAVTPAALRARLLSPDARRALGGYRAEDRYDRAMADAPARTALDRAQHADVRFRLPGEVLCGLDRTGMAAGLAVRVPLLDHRLLEFCAALPPRMRLNGGRGKWLMTQVMAPFLPVELLRRPEPARASAPDVRVPADAAALARSRLLDDTGWFDMEVIGELVADERAGHGCTLRLLVMLERSLHRLFDASA